MATNKRGRQPVDCVFFASFSTTRLPPFWADVGLCGPRPRRLGEPGPTPAPISEGRDV